MFVGAIKLPSGALLTKLNNLETVAMPTLTTKVNVRLSEL